MDVKLRYRKFESRISGKFEPKISGKFQPRISGKFEYGCKVYMTDHGLSSNH